MNHTKRSEEIGCEERSTNPNPSGEFFLRNSIQHGRRECSSIDIC